MVNLLYGILTMCLSKQAACMQRTITVQQVLPDLYLGNFKDARDREQLTRNNITHILSIHDSAAPILPGMTYLCISAADLPTQNLLAGVSRSVTLVVAYIMTVTGLGWQEALAAVRVARPCAGPNLGFQRQLQEFETNHADQFREWLWQLYKERPFNDEDDIRILLAKSFKPNGVGVEVNVEPSTPPGLQGT
ncbi:dual specificity protein phosphatase 22-B isoform X3 [Oncorhynchus tshawytscha]|uniref:dual specificity protein phosphatase 22-B isoform X3 n=1 Tax=Oncorhynchus tshawytscha TaxID=74940 RepID=UPI001C3C9D53|nr:dual specificity protein phosphatase 22-B isoform X3 [Oncorhynchus tshawytscha]